MPAKTGSRYGSCSCTAGMAYEFLNPLLNVWHKTPEASCVHDDAFIGAYLMPLVYEPGAS